MGGINVTPAVLNAMFTGYSTLYQTAYTTADIFYPKLAMKTNSSTASELIGWMDKIPTVRKWVGSRVVANASLRYRTLKNESFETTLQIPRDTVLDDQFGLYAPMATMQGTQMAKWPDREIAKLIKLNSNAGPIAFDGVHMFDIAHPVNIDDGVSGPLGTYSNVVTFAQSGGSFITGYGLARARLRGFKGADGEPMGLMGRTLAVSPKWEKQALELANSIFYPEAAQGQAVSGPVGSVSNVWKGGVDPVVIPELDGTAYEDNAYLIADNVPLKPWIFQERQAPIFTPMFNPTDPAVFWMKQYVMGADSRGAFDVTLPFLAVQIKLA